MLNTKVTLFPGHIQSNNDEIFTQQLLSLTIDKMSLFLSSGDVEAQERVSVILHILKTTLKLIEKSGFNINEPSALFDSVLNPVAAKAQRKVIVPNGLNLDAWINDSPSDSEDESVTTSSHYDNKDLFYGDNGE
ncbi:unnamed protein product, partial [Rotaria sp. Silwood1]